MSILNATKPVDVRVSMLMNKKIISVQTDFSVPDVAHLLTRHNISSVPVLNKELSVVGFVTLGDCLKCMVNCLYHGHNNLMEAKDIMTKEVVKVPETLDLFSLEDLLISKNIHDAPVVNENDEMVGMITRKAAVKGIEQLYRETLQYKASIKEPLEMTAHERMRYTMKHIS